MKLSRDVPLRGPGIVEADFLRYVTSSDREALDATMKHVAPELRRIARYYVRNPDLTEDLVQATILTAIERASSFDPERRLVPWMSGILLNKIAAHRREVRRHRLDPERDDPVEPSPLHVAESKEVERLVGEALAQLPPRYREVLDLYLRQGMRGGEIADELERPPGTIRAQIHRGLRRLRNLLPPSLALGGLLAFLRPARAATRRSGTIPVAGVPLAPLLAGLAGLGALLAVLAALGFLPHLGRRTSAAERGANSPALVAATTRAPVDAAPADEDATTRAPVPSPSADGAGLSGETASLRLVVTERVLGHTLAGAGVDVVVETSQGARRHFEGVTAADGEVTLPLDPSTAERVVVHASLAGFATLGAEWDRGGAVFDADVPLRVPLMRTRPIGGLVTDVDGDPVAGARIYLVGGMLSNGTSWGYTSDEQSTTSGADGRWHIEEAAAAPIQILVRAVHPDYVPSLGYVPESSPATEALWNLEGRIVLETGQPLELEVRDQAGRIVEGFEVELLDAHDPPRFVSAYPIDEEQRARGRLRLTAPRDGRFLLRVRAPGHVTQIQLMRPPLSETLLVRMPRSEDRLVRIVDADGRPVSDAQVRRFGVPWSEALETDETGGIELALHSAATSWLQVRRGSVIGSAQVQLDVAEGIAKLPAPRRLFVRVLDAANGTPVGAHRLSILTATGKPLGSRAVSGGEPVDIAVHDPAERHGHGMQVEASALGYRSRVSPLIYPGSEPLEVELALERSEVLTIDVLGSGGDPVDFLEVAIASPGHPVEVENGTLRASSLHPTKVQSDSGNGVRLNRPEGAFALVVMSRDGVALVRDFELEASTTVEVLPWGCVQGSAPERASVVLESWADEDIVRFRYSARPDAGGAFHLCGVAPESYVLALQEGGLPPATVEVRPGETAAATF